MMNNKTIMTIAVSAIAGMVVAFGGAYLLIKEVKPDSSPSQAAASVSQAASEPPAASQVHETPHETSQNRLVKIFTPDMLDADLAYLETITGVAKSTDNYGHFKTYDVDGCTVEVSYSGKQITSLGLTLSKSCQINPSKFVNTTVQSTKNLTFGALDKSLGNTLQYQAVCLGICGNAIGTDTVSAIYSGSHAENFIDIKVEATPDVNLSPWVETMERQEGSDWVESRGYNCSQKYDDIARKTLAKQRINKITFGRDLPTETCN